MSIKSLLTAVCLFVFLCFFVFVFIVQLQTIFTLFCSLIVVQLYLTWFRRFNTSFFHLFTRTFSTVQSKLSNSSFKTHNFFITFFFGVTCDLLFLAWYYFLESLKILFAVLYPLNLFIFKLCTLSFLLALLLSYPLIFVSFQLSKLPQKPHICFLGHRK